MSTRPKAAEPDEVRAALNRASNVYNTITSVIELGNRVRNYWRQRRNYTVTVASTDSCYQDIHDWLLANVPVQRQRALAVHTERYSDEDDDYATPVEIGSTARTERTLRVTYESNTEQRIEVDGRPVWVCVEHGGDPTERYRKPDEIVFRCTSKATQQSVIDHLQQIVANRKVAKRQPQMRMMTQWGTWQVRHDIPPRPLGSVVLRAGQMESLISDLGDFLDREAEYARRAIPWHRGYLFQGPPGTGKTSLAKALANHFGLDLYYAPLGDVPKDTNLLSLIGDVRPRSVLLLEDIDIYHAATSREAKAEQVSLSGLLNALDGVSTPNGLITILTSNDPKVLDDALVRPGRVDRVEDIGYVTDEQADRLFTYFYGREPAEPWCVDAQTSCADLTEIFKRHMDDAAAAERVLVARSMGLEVSR